MMNTCANFFPAIIWGISEHHRSFVTLHVQHVLDQELTIVLLVKKKTQSGPMEDVWKHAH